MSVKINKSELESFKRSIRRSLFIYGQSAVTIARENAPEDTGALKRSIRFESVTGTKPFNEDSDKFQLIAGGVIDPDRPDGVDYAELQELIHAYLRSTIPFLLKF
jgi:hypothetical protein